MTSSAQTIGKVDFDKLMPLKLVATKFGVDISTLHRWQKDPSINFPNQIKIGTRVYFDGDEIEAFLTKLKH